MKGSLPSEVPRHLTGGPRDEKKAGSPVAVLGHCLSQQTCGRRVSGRGGAAGAAGQRACPAGACLHRWQSAGGAALRHTLTGGGPG